MNIPELKTRNLVSCNLLNQTKGPLYFLRAQRELLHSITTNIL